MSSGQTASTVRAMPSRGYARPVNRQEQPNQVPGAPQLRVLAAKRPRRTSLHAAVAIVLLLVAAFVVPTIANAQMAIDAHKIAETKRELTEIQMDNEILRNQLKVEQSAPELAKKAAGQGLVPAGQAGTIKLGEKSIQPGKAAGEK